MQDTLTTIQDGKSVFNRLQKGKFKTQDKIVKFRTSLKNQDVCQPFVCGILYSTTISNAFVIM